MQKALSKSQEGPCSKLEFFYKVHNLQNSVQTIELIEIRDRLKLLQNLIVTS